MNAFDHNPRTRLVYGNGALSRIGELVHELGGHRVLVVSDAGIVKAGHAERAMDCLKASGLTVTLFDQVHENPTTKDVDLCVAAARACETDFLIGLGGGSSMDTAKGCNFILTNGGRMHDYWGVGKATEEMLPMIAIPTTAGTGSECQSFALISDEETHVKMACGDPKAAARIALLDPELTISQPPRVTAMTGIDAIAHALETAVTTKRNALSGTYSRQAFRFLMKGFERVLAEPADLEARSSMLLGAAFAGIAIENSMLGAAHSCANPLSAQYHMVHGQAVGLMLPHVIRFNSVMPEAAAIYHSYFEGDLAAQVVKLLRVARLETNLTALDVKEESIPSLAAMASKQWTAQFNPRLITESDFAELYQSAMHD